MSFFKYLFFVFFFTTPMLCFAQKSDSLNHTYNSKFDVALGGSVEYTTPQKYGAAVNFTFGQRVSESISSDGFPPQTNIRLKGINFEGGLYRGGYRLGLYYINVGYSMIGVAGTRLGFVYLQNNSFSNVFESTDLIGVEAEFLAFYKLKLGLLKAMDKNRYIPSIGFGFGIGPSF